MNQPSHPTTRSSNVSSPDWLKALFPSRISILAPFYASDFSISLKPASPDLRKETLHVIYALFPWYRERDVSIVSPHSPDDVAAIANVHVWEPFASLLNSHLSKMFFSENKALEQLKNDLRGQSTHPDALVGSIWTVSSRRPSNGHRTGNLDDLIRFSGSKALRSSDELLGRRS